jgi:hypothetical protein
MKTFFVLVITFVALHFMFADDVLVAQTKDGFKGFPWGTDVAMMKRPLGLRLKDSAEGSARYFTNVKSIGSVKLKDCWLWFYKGKFSSLHIFCEGYLNQRRLLQILQEILGDEVAKFPSGSEMHVWKSEKTMTIFSVQKDSMGWLSMSSDSLSDVMKQDGKEKVRKDAREFQP